MVLPSTETAARTRPMGYRTRLWLDSSGEIISPPRGSWLLVGALSGLSASVVGVPSVIPSVGLRPWHILAIAALFVAVGASKNSPGILRLSWLDLSLLGYAAVCILAEIYNASELEYPIDVGTVLSPLYYLIGYYAARITIESRVSAGVFLGAFAAVSIPMSVVSLGQLGSAEVSRAVLAIAPGPGLEARIEDGRLIRATGFVGHWTGLGFYFCACLAAACMATLLLAPTGRIPWILKGAIVFAFLGALSSLTLSVLTTAILIILGLLAVRGLKVSTLWSVGAVTVIAYLKFGEYFEDRIDQQTAARLEYLPSWVPNTLAYRWRIWTEQTIPVIQERLLTGWGSNLYSGRDRPRILVWHSPESQWFGSAISYGIIGAVSLAMVLVATIYYFAYRVRMVEHRYKLPGLMLIVGSTVASFTVPVFTNRGFPVALWMLLGVIVSVHFLTTRPTVDAL